MGMKKFALQSKRIRGREPSCQEGALPSLDECRQLSKELKESLQSVEQKIQTAHSRLVAEASRDARDEAFIHGASATVILSIAASMMEFASCRTGRTLDEEAFIAAARDAAQDASDRSAGKCGSPLPSDVTEPFSIDERDS
jgi:hypothetical protein